MREHERTGPIDTLTWSFSRIAIWAPAFIVVIIFYEVFMRYVLFKPTLWVNEMSLWVGGAIYVTAGLYSMQQRSHIRIFVLYDMAPPWLRKVFDAFSVLCVCIFAFAVIWGGFGEAAAKFWRFETFGTAFDPPIPATTKPLVLITLFILALQAVSNLIRDWPSAAWIRKTFDLLATAAILYLTYLAVPVLLNFAEVGPINQEGSGPKLEMKWRIGLGALLAWSVYLVLLGLWRDFNRDPIPYEEVDDEDEFDLPPEVISGNPPKQSN